MSRFFANLFQFYSSLFLNLQFCPIGKGKGTPSIRTGIRCIGTDTDYESETSDWPGYGRSTSTETSTN